MLSSKDSRVYFKLLSANGTLNVVTQKVTGCLINRGPTFQQKKALAKEVKPASTFKGSRDYSSVAKDNESL